MSNSPLQKIRSVFKKSSTLSSINSNPNNSDSDDRDNASRSKSPMSTSFADFEEPPLTPLVLKGYKPGTKHRLLSPELAEEIRQHIPSLLQINHSWHLLYSIEQSGTSLQTLYSNCQPKFGENLNRRRGYILVVQDTHKNIFGAYLNDHLRNLDGKYYYGNGDCFLWKCEKGKMKHLDPVTKSETKGSPQDELVLKVFPYTSLNDFIIYSNNNFISVGSGDGKFGLWIDSNLEIGASDTVETFGNEPLSDTKKFHILGLEVWRIC
jgi:hypothetical protein